MCSIWDWRCCNWVLMFMVTGGSFYLACAFCISKFVAKDLFLVCACIYLRKWNNFPLILYFQGSIPVAELLLSLGGTFFSTFWRLIFLTVASFFAVYLVSFSLTFGLFYDLLLFHISFSLCAKHSIIRLPKYCESVVTF